MTSFLIIAILFLALLVALGFSFYSFIIGAPYLWTPKKALKEIFEAAQIKPGEIFYDLGAGDGKALLIAEKDFGARAIGFELSPIMNVLAKLNLFFHDAKNSKVYLKNFYKQDLADAGTVFCFLTLQTMAKLKPKLEKELRPGTKVISYCFSIHGWEPKKIITGTYLRNLYLYEI